jgi:hypothetical protein
MIDYREWIEQDKESLKMAVIELRHMDENDSDRAELQEYIDTLNARIVSRQELLK